MPFNPVRHHRRSLRLKDYDYAQAGAYFVTICAWRRECLWGKVVGEIMQLNEEGQIVGACWDALVTHFTRVELDAFVVMPNHLHGVIVITEDVGMRGVGARQAQPSTINRASPLHAGRPRSGLAPQSLGAIVGSFKSAATKRINQLRVEPGLPIWQRNYFERVIRNARELTAIRRYIENNPLQWALDRDNPLNGLGQAKTVDDYLREAAVPNQ